jgi:hypothetical protein
MEFTAYYRHIAHQIQFIIHCETQILNGISDLTDVLQVYNKHFLIFYEFQCNVESARAQIPHSQL